MTTMTNKIAIISTKYFKINKNKFILTSMWINGNSISYDIISKTPTYPPPSVNDLIVQLYYNPSLDIQSYYRSINAIAITKEEYEQEDVITPEYAYTYIPSTLNKIEYTYNYKISQETEY